MRIVLVQAAPLLISVQPALLLLSATLLQTMRLLRTLQKTLQITLMSCVRRVPPR